MLRNSLKTGIGFGISSSTITTLGLMTGLFAGTESRLVVIGAILTIAVADAFSDSLAIHIAEESKKETKKHIWESTISAFFTKFFAAIIYLPAVILLSVELGVIVNIFLGMILLGAYSYYVAMERKDNPIYTIFEHIGVGAIVIAITYFLGRFISIYFV
jgi:VIT1/CCC1 family predicted Fe2+/Mn2+ transporter